MKKVVKIRRHLITFFVSGMLSIQGALAYDSGSFQVSRTIGEVLAYLIRAFQNPSIRHGLSLILIVAILVALYDSAVKKIAIFSQNSRMIAVPLAILSTLAIYWKIKPDVISNMFLLLVVALILIYLIKGILWVSRHLKGGYNPNRAIRDERHIRNEADQSRALENQMMRNEDTLGREMHEERYDSEAIRRLADEIRRSAGSGQNDLHRLRNDTRRD